MNKPAVRKLLQSLIRQRNSKQAAARFNMEYFGIPFDEARRGILTEIAPVCNTQSCLAGEAVILFKGGFFKRTGGIELYKKYRVRGLDIQEAAADLLSLTPQEEKRLFFFERQIGEPGWPKKYEREYDAAETPSERLGVTIRRVAFFLTTDGTD